MYNQHDGVCLRLIFTESAVKFMFGDDNVLVVQLMEQTGAVLTISRPNVASRTDDMFVSVMGDVPVVVNAVSLICRKFWDFTNVMNEAQNGMRLRLAVPSPQCGSIVGSKGSQVKSICQLSGAHVQVGNVPLYPGTDEKGVNISGSGESCVQALQSIAAVLNANPLRDRNGSFNSSSGCGDVGGRRMSHSGSRMSQQSHFSHGGQPIMQDGEGDDSIAWTPIFLCQDQAYIIDGQIARPAAPEVLRRELAHINIGQMAESIATLNNSAPVPPIHALHNPSLTPGPIDSAWPVKGNDVSPFTAFAPTLNHPPQDANVPRLYNNVNSGHQVPDYAKPLTPMNTPASASTSVAADHTPSSSSPAVVRQDQPAMPPPPPPQMHATKTVPIARDVADHLFGGGPAKVAEMERISGARIVVVGGGPADAQQQQQGAVELQITGTDETVLLAQFLIQSQMDMAMAKQRRDSQDITAPLTQQTQQHSLPPPASQFNFPATVARGGAGGGSGDERPPGWSRVASASSFAR